MQFYAYSLMDAQSEAHSVGLKECGGQAESNGMEQSEWSGMLEPESGCLRWGNLTKEWWCGVENSWARNQLASHNEGLLRLLLFSGGVIEEHGGGMRGRVGVEDGRGSARGGGGPDGNYATAVPG